ncbi:50S ribosomal protein L20 [Candidatus Phytoplasma oryzae]|nr:50S ribosomal protein L20 [Candidatus Phytoplasma oryzae]
MVKINFTNARRKKRKKILKLAKGYFGSKSILYKTAHEQVMRSLQYAYRDRRRKKRDFRKLWITRVNAGCLNNNISYSLFMHGLKLSKTEINRKMLAEIAFSQPQMFKEYVNLSKKYLDQKQNNILNISDTNNNLELTSSSLSNEDLNIDSSKIEEKTLEDDNNQNIKKKDNNIVLEKMLLTDLRILARERKIKNFSKLKKTELINILKNK